MGTVRWWGRPGLVGGSVEFVWAVQETCVIPYFKWLGLPLEYAALLYVINPLLSFAMAPVVGRLSDKWGRRKPFLALFASTAVAGLCLFGFSYKVSLVVHRRAVGLALAFLGFALSDFSCDMLLIPSRAMVQDRSANSLEASRMNAEFSFLQMVGRFFACFLGTFSVEKLVFFSSDKQRDDAPLVHMQGLCLVGGVCHLVCCSLVLMGSPSEQRDESKRVGSGTDKSAFTSVRDTELLSSEKSTLIEQKSGSYSTPLHHAHHQQQPNLYASMSAGVERRSRRKQRLAALAVVHFLGWFGIMVYTLYWTAFVTKSNYVLGVQVQISYLGLALGSLGAVIVSQYIHGWNRRFGPTLVYFCGECFCFLAMYFTKFLGNSFASIIPATVAGCTYAIHQTNPYIILFPEQSQDHSKKIQVSRAGPQEHQDEDNENGWMASIINAMMALAQVFVGLLSGSLIEWAFLGDYAAFFSAFSLVALGCTILIAVWLSKNDNFFLTTNQPGTSDTEGAASVGQI